MKTQKIQLFKDANIVNINVNYVNLYFWSITK